MLPNPPTTDPDVVVAIREFKAGLIMREAAQMEQMASQWYRLEQSLSGTIQLLAQDLSAMRAAGEVVSMEEIYRLRRYKLLLAQTQEQMQAYTNWASGQIANWQVEAGRLGIDHGARAVQLALTDAGSGVVDATFERLPVEAIESMVGNMADGSTVGTHLRSILVRDRVTGAPLPGMIERVTSTLLESTAIGRNPRETARLMQDAFTGGLQQSMTVARTEQIRVYREANRMQFQQTNVVIGQKRIVAHDDRVCPACLADEGTVYALNETIPDHPNGRCSGVPIIRNRQEPRWTEGEQWFMTQPESVQRSILGPGRLRAYQDGQFSFRDLSARVDDSVWGASVRPRTLQELTNP